MKMALCFSAKIYCATRTLQLETSGMLCGVVERKEII